MNEAKGMIKNMRLDKYLKVSRIIKRRTVANEACDSGRVMLNDKVARASAEVKAGDVIEIAFGTKAVKVKVTSVPIRAPSSTGRLQWRGRSACCACNWRWRACVAARSGENTSTLYSVAAAVSKSAAPSVLVMMRCALALSGPR